MATPIPALVSEVNLTTTNDGVQLNGGSAQTLQTSNYHFFVSNVTTSGDGLSLLYDLEAKLNSSGAGGNIVVYLDTDYKVVIEDSGPGGPYTIDTLEIWQELGFASAPPYVISNGGTKKADYLSQWFWSPDMSISETGPTFFDPAETYGVPSSAGSAHWSPDMTAAYTKNGVQVVAQYVFRGVEYQYKTFKRNSDATKTNQDWETFWRNNVSAGRRVLMWRNRDNAAVNGNGAPSEGSASPWNYIEYQPSDDMRRQMLVVPTQPPRVTHYDHTWDFLVTENGETPYTD